MRIHNIITLVCFIVALPIWQDLYARNPYRPQSNTTDSYHFIYITGSGGYSSLKENNNYDITTTGNFGGVIGLGYEMRVNNFWMSIGGDLSFLQNKSIMASSYKTTHDAKDTQGKPIVMNYDITRQEDMNKWWYGNLPLMFGGYYNMFYAGAGVKVGFPIKGLYKNSTHIQYSTSASYPQYIDDFKEMTNHFYGDFDTITTNNIKLNTNVAIIGEIGVDVLANVRNHSDFCHVLKIGFYFEYGVLSLMNHTDGNNERVLFPNETNATLITASPHSQWLDNTSYSCHSYFVGLKITYMFGGSKSQNANIWHTGCMCYDNKTRH